MRYGILAVLLAVAVYVFLCGCGTVQNLASDKQQVFGGTRLDVEVATVGLVHEPGQNADTDPSRHDLPTELRILLAAWAWFDLPLTLVGDTVTLPWTVTAEVKRLLEPLDKPEK